MRPVAHALAQETAMPDMNQPEPRPVDMMEMMRNAFDGSGQVRSRMSSQIADLAQAQQQILREWEDMAHGWFARRHSGTQAALETAREIARCNDPTEAMGACQRWFADSMSRMAADALDAQSHGARMMKACAEALRANGEIPAAAAPRRGESGPEPKAARRAA
jgi:hypothetical protein